MNRAARVKTCTVLATGSIPDLLTPDCWMTYSALLSATFAQPVMQWDESKSRRML